MNAKHESEKTMKQSVMCIVQSSAQADGVARKLRATGFSRNDISVLYPNKDGTRDFAHELHNKAPEGAIAGVGAGGIVGGAVGILAGIGAMVIPGLGAFIAAGPLLGALGGAAAGAAMGGIAGALVGMGIPEIEAKRFEGKVRGGNILLSVHVDTSDERACARSICEVEGAEDICESTEAEVPRRSSHEMPSLTPRSEV